MVNLQDIKIGVEVIPKNEEILYHHTRYFEDLTKAALYAHDVLNNGHEIKMHYCDKYGSKIGR